MHPQFIPLPHLPKTSRVFCEVQHRIHPCSEHGTLIYPYPLSSPKRSFSLTSDKAAKGFLVIEEAEV